MCSTRIFAVGLSADRKYCCIGGLGESLCVASGLTGQLLFSVPAEGQLESLSLLEGASDGGASDGGVCVAFGGDFGTTRVLDLQKRRITQHLPTEGQSTLSVALTVHCVAFASGACATCFGQGGYGTSRHDQPTFRFLAQLVRHAASDDDGGSSLKALACALDAHPTCINAREPSRGTTLLQYAVQSADVQVLQLLLRPSECRIGLHQDLAGGSVLSKALEPGRRQQLRTILQAFLGGRFTLSAPGSIAVLSSCCARRATGTNSNPYALLPHPRRDAARSHHPSPL